MNDHQQFMQLALEQARLGEAQGEVPVGAVLVRDGQVIAAGYNQPISSCDPTAHAEIVAMRAAGQALENYRLLDTALYVTLEPCMMCLGAMTHARVKELIYAAPDPKVGAVNQLQELSKQAHLNHQLDVVSGILQEESSELLKNFFRQRRS